MHCIQPSAGSEGKETPAAAQLKLGLLHKRAIMHA